MIFVMYMVAMRALYLTEQRNTSTIALGRTERMLKAALMGYGVTSAAIVGAGIWLPIIGVELARVMGWLNSFAGTLFVAFATSVPELATTAPSASARSTWRLAICWEAICLTC